MLRASFVIVSCVCMMVGGSVWATEQAAAPKTAIKGSGLPIPRFVMTKASKVNLRAGPGNNYPTRVVYNRKGIPLKVIAEFDFWRKVQDLDGQEGWIHKTLLSNNTVVWVKADMVSLLSDSDCPESVVLKAEKGVEGESLKDAKGKYAKVRIGGQKGWVLIDDIWGVLSE